MMAAHTVASARLLFTQTTLLALCTTPSRGWSWPWDPARRGESTMYPGATLNPGNYTKIDACPLQQCHYRMEKMVSFSCPLSGCTSISDEIMLNVQDLRLQNNDIAAIPELPFSSLQELDLADNNISRIDDNAFTKLTNLTMLYLSNNKITNLKRIHFEGLLNLKYLYLDQNSITVLDRDVFFPALVSIERIDLSSNSINSIDESALVQLSMLRFLHLERNNITNITRAHLTQLPKLEELTLNQNHISTIEPHTFGDLDRLRMLDLGYNHIQHLQNNSFSLDSPDIFHSHLQRLVLNNNSIESIDDSAFAGLPSLQILHLPYNPLKEFPSCYLPTSLEEISLHHMLELRSIPKGVFANLTILRTAEIYGNPKLTVVSPGSFWTNFKQIQLIDLSRNNLRTMPESIIKDWRKIPSVDLSGNPWHCDCRLQWMKEVYMNSVDRATIRCHTPQRLSGKSITSITVEEFLCGIELMGITVRRRTGVLLIVAVSLAFVSFIGLFLYRCRHRVFPCRYGQTSQYRALYSPKADEEDDVTITGSDVMITGGTITVTESEKKILQAQANGKAPIPVAL